MNNVLNLSLEQVAWSFLYLIALLIILRRKHIRREREILLASLRMTIQLVAVGFILIYLFENIHPLTTVAVLLVMEVFAVRNIVARSKNPLSKRLKNVVALSIGTGTLSSILFFLLVVVRITPWYEPRYFIPIAGMLIGNSMTGISLGVFNLVEGMQTQRNRIETSLMLGATPQAATKHILDHAFDSSILPTMNAMLGMGIVFLPGMMTGQILSGTSPLIAIKYQIAIMLGILGSVSFSVLLFVHLGYRTYFNHQNQFILSEQTTKQ